MAIITLGSPLRDRVLSAQTRLQAANVLAARLQLDLELHGSRRDCRMLEQLQREVAAAGRLLQQS